MEFRHVNAPQAMMLDFKYRPVPAEPVKKKEKPRDGVHARLEKKLKKRVPKSKRWHAEGEIAAIERSNEHIERFKLSCATFE